MATVDVEVHTTIDPPRHDVAAYCCEPANVTAWQANIRSVRWETDPPVVVGSRFHFTSGFLGRTMEYSYEVVELVPGRRFVMRSDRGPFAMETSYRWEDSSEGGTFMTLRNRGEPMGFAGLATPLLTTAVRRATTKDLGVLKVILERR